MALKAENKGSNSGDGSKSQPNVGTHMARLVGLTDLGHQPAWEYKGQEMPSTWKIEFTYELPNSLMDDGRPHWVSEEVKVNKFEGKGIISTMMARIRTLDPQNETNDGEDLTGLLGRPCMVTVSPGNSGYVKLKGQSAVSGIPMGLEVPALQNDPFSFDMDDPDLAVWDSFPQFIQNKIKRALNYKESSLYREIGFSEDM